MWGGQNMVYGLWPSILKMESLQWGTPYWWIDDHPLYGYIKHIIHLLTMALKWGHALNNVFFFHGVPCPRCISLVGFTIFSIKLWFFCVFFLRHKYLGSLTNCKYLSMVSKKKLCWCHSQRFYRLVSYVCTYVHMHVCIMHVRAYAPMHVCTYVRMHACSIFTYAHMYVCTHALCTYARMHVCTYAHLHVCTSARMHVCTYARMHYAHTHVCTYARMHVCILHVRAYARMHVWTYVRMHVCMHICIMHVCTYAHMHVNAYARMHVCTYARKPVCTYARMHVCTCVRMHACTYVRMQVCTLCT